MGNGAPPRKLPCKNAESGNKHSWENASPRVFARRVKAEGGS